MKWEPLFAQLLKLFIHTDKLKKEDSEIKTPGAADGQPIEQSGFGQIMEQFKEDH